MIKELHKKIVKKIKKDNERGARKSIIEELFYDFNRNKTQVYWMNFTRGIFFGFGSVLGATVVVAIIVWILAQFAGLFPSIGSYIQQIIDAMQRSN
jgi:hypothetical protein